MKKFTFLFFAMLMSTVWWQSNAQTYCPPGTVSYVEPITSVVYAGISNTSSASISEPGYEDFTSIVGNVDAGVAQQIELQGNTDGPYTSHYTVFIDWNQNGVLNDAGEMYEIGSVNGSTGTDGKKAIGSITAPGNAMAGNTLMRVIKNYNSSFTNPCGAPTFGQIEDYTVNVTVPSCVPPSDLAATPTSVDAATISWTASQSSPIGYEYALTTSDTPPASGTVTTNTTIEDVAIQSAVENFLHVRSNCDGDGYSSWTTYSFMAPTPGQIGDLELAASLPINSCYNFNYSQQLYFADELNEALEGGTNYISKIRFYYQTPASSGTDNWNNWTVYMANTTKTEFTSATDWVAGSELTQVFSGALNIPDAGNWMEITLNPGFMWDGTSNLVIAVDENVSGYNCTAAFGAFNDPAEVGRTLLHTSDTVNSDPNAPPAATGWYLTVNTLQLESDVPPSCLSPLALTADAIAATTADVSWTAGGSETSWNFSWGAPGYTPGVDDLGTDTASTTSYQLAGLTPQTSYDVYVQADCGSSDLSNWAGPLSFTTACGTITEMFEDFDSYDTGSIVPDCWERIVPATSVGSQTISSTSPASGTRNIYQYTSSSQNSVIVALPEFSNVNAGTHWLKLKARVSTGSGALSVGYVTDVSDYNSFTLIEDVTITNTSYASNSEYTVVIPNTVPAGARLGIKSAANGTSHYWDDVTWEQAPSCLEPSSLEVTGLTSTTADVAWVANNAETSWNVSWGAPGYTPGDTEEISTAVASTNSYQIGGLSADSYYDVYVQANCGAVDGESTWAGPLSVYTGYCIPSGSSNNTDEIRNFTLNNLNNDSAASEGTNGYSDYTTSVAPAELQAGVSYTASLTSGTGSGNHGAAIWIDLDQNLVFDSSEMVAFLPSTIGANATVDFPAFTLPPNLPLGTYRLRVQYHYSKSGDLLDPCVTTTSYSETEDYAVTVLAPPACLPPVDILADSITSSSADINWTESGTANTWHIEYGITGFTQGDGTTVPNITSRPYNLTGLSANTQYDVYVRSVCGAGTLNPTISDWTGPLSFTTLCAVVSDFYEDFEATTGTNLPNCWSKVGTTGIVETRASTKLSGARVLYVYNNVTVALPVVDNAAAGTHQIAMDVVGNISSGGTIELGYLTDATDATSFVSISSITTNSTTVSQEFTTIPTGMPAGDFVFAIYSAGTTSSLIDNVRWEPIPSCPTPTDLTVAAIEANTADIEWEVGNVETAWNVSWGAPGYTPGDNDLGTAPSSSTSYQITGLDANTQYEVYVQADCGGSDLSNWISPVSFTTSCETGTVPFAEKFENSYSNDAPLSGCWSQENGNWRTFNVSSTYGRVARTGDSYVSLRYGNDDWIYYPLNLTGGTTYTLSFYARQDATSGASVKASFGTSPSVSAMTNEILPQTDVTSDTYMEFSENFTPDSDGIYFVGINGTLDYTPWYLTIDDISVTEATVSGYVYENGAWSPSDPSGVATIDDDITIINGAASLTADTGVKNLIVMADATLEVNNVLTLGGDITNDGNLVFVSSATGNGELAAVPGTSTITGDVTVQRYMQNKRSYRMVSSAVTTTSSIHDNWQEGASSNADNPNPGFGTHITGSTTDQMNGFDGTITGNPSMFTVNVNTQEFEAIDNTDTNTLAAGDSYLLFVRGDRSTDLTNDLAAGETVLRATGSLITGAHSQSFPTATNGNFVMFGNPYQSAVNVNDVFAGSTNVNSDFLYVYDPSAGTHG